MIKGRDLATSDESWKMKDDAHNSKIVPMNICSARSWWLRRCWSDHRTRYLPSDLRLLGLRNSDLNKMLLMTKKLGWSVTVGACRTQWYILELVILCAKRDPGSIAEACAVGWHDALLCALVASSWAVATVLGRSLTEIFNGVCREKSRWPDHDPVAQAHQLLDGVLCLIRCFSSITSTEHISL